MRADDLSVMQSLEALPFITQSARAIYGDKPYRIGPSTIAMRQNPYGSATKDNPELVRIAMANRDPRHDALFAAAWTVGYAARVAQAGLNSWSCQRLCRPLRADCRNRRAGAHRAESGRCSMSLGRLPGLPACGRSRSKSGDDSKIASSPHDRRPATSLPWSPISRPNSVQLDLAGIDRAGRAGFDPRRESLDGAEGWCVDQRES